MGLAPLRAQEPIHRILRELTAGPGPDLLDLPALFRALSPGGLIGNETLIDHIHPFPEGNLRIALEIIGWMKEKSFIKGDYSPGEDELNSIYQEVMDSLPPEYFRHGILNLAKVFIWAKKNLEAYSVLESHWSDLSEDGEARYLMGTVLLDLGAPLEALEHLQKARELAPEHLMVLAKLGQLYSLLGQTDSAVALYTKGLKLYPDNIILLSDYGLLLNRLGQTDKAFKYLLRAQHIDPAAPGVNNNLGTAYALSGQYPKAIEAFLKAIENDPRDPEPCYNLGNVYAMLKNWEQAEKFFLEALRRDPKHTGAHINLGNVYLNTNRLYEAEMQFQLALEINPNLKAPYVNLAKLYRTTGRDSLARILTRQALKRFAGDSLFRRLITESR